MGGRGTVTEVLAIVISHSKWPRAFGAAAGSQHAAAH